MTASAGGQWRHLLWQWLVGYKPQSSGTVSKSRWTSWASVPNKPTVFVDVKQHSTNQHVNHCLTFVPLTQSFFLILFEFEFDRLQSLQACTWSLLGSLISIPRQELKRKNPQKRTLLVFIYLLLCAWHKLILFYFCFSGARTQLLRLKI